MNTRRVVMLFVLMWLVLWWYLLKYHPAYGAYPALPAPQGIMPTSQQILLGQQLFFDPRLSVNGTISCSTCHDPRFGYSDPFPRALGLTLNNGNRPEGQRRSPTIINAAYSPLMFWDGRTNGRFNNGTSALASQALQPIVNPIEMGNQSENQVLNRLRNIPGYRLAFEQAYGAKQNGASVIDRDRFGHALASFQSTIVSFGCPVDYRVKGRAEAVTPAAEVGLALMEKASCFTCHRAPFYTTYGFANNGFGYATGNNDRGRIVQTNDPDHLRAFKIPPLREVARRSRFGHDGGFPSMEAVVAHYSRGGVRPDGLVDPNLDRRIKPQDWNAQQQANVVAALEAFSSKTYPIAYPPRLP